MFRNKYAGTKRRFITSFWCFLFLQLIGSKLIAQNLINNGSFEDILNPCPASGYNNIVAAINWENPINTTINSPDLFSTCFNGTSSVGVPSNGDGFQYPYYGNNYAGIFAFDSRTAQNEKGSEMIETKLPLLQKDYVYYMRFFVSLAEKTSNVKCWKLGALFSDSLINVYGSFKRFNYTPQIVNDSLDYISDTLNWTKIDGLYQATGSEQYLLISDFDANYYDTLKYKTSITGHDKCYIYIDNVELYELTPTKANAGRDTAICTGSSVTLGTANAQRFVYSWYPSNGLSATNVAQPIASPTQTTTYYLKVSDPYMDTLSPNPTTIDSVTITVYPLKQLTASISPLYGRLCPDDTITLQGSRCYGCNFSWEPLTYLQSPNAAKTICKPETSINYTYSVWHTNTDTCFLSASTSINILVLETCDTLPVTINIPNIFTPNADWVNDVFEIATTGIKELTAEIYNRWGERIYAWQGIEGNWDGTSSAGMTAPEGVYYYIVKTTSREGESKEYKGYVQLCR